MTALIPAYLKTTYKNDPTFKHSKIVYSVYETCFNEKLNSEFSRKATMTGMTAEDTALFNANDCDSLHCGAINFSDAVVLGSANINQEVLNYVKNSNKQVLDYDSTSDFENYYNLYEEIASEDLVSLA
jgi:starch synthase